MIETIIAGPASKGVVFICINGILTWPGDAEGWTDRAVTWLNLHTEGKAEKFEYATGALTRRLWQDYRAQAIARMASFYVQAGYEVVFIAHSNGCDLVARVLKILWPVKIRSAHLFAAATDDEPLGHSLRSGQLGRLHLYGSANDKALQFAGISRKLVGWAGLGYGNLGIRIEQFAADYPNVEAHPDDEKGHGTWLERGENFERSMRAVLENEFDLLLT